MRLAFGTVNVYYLHDTLTPDNIRVATHTNDDVALVPETGDILRGFPGWTGTEPEAITVKVVSVKPIGDHVEAYEVLTTTVTEG